jgi:hypothetical protein
MRALKPRLSLFAVVAAGILAGCSMGSPKVAGENSDLGKGIENNLDAGLVITSQPTREADVRNTRMSICKVSHRGLSRWIYGVRMALTEPQYRHTLFIPAPGYTE